ncbi:ribosomal RNA processing protein 36 homolog isoform 2-T2 [Synchiropus picturatus]
MRPKERRSVVLSSDEEEEDSDMEENFVLLTEGRRRGEGKPEEEEGCAEEEDEEEEDAGGQEESGDEEEAVVDTNDEDDSKSDGDEDDDHDEERGEGVRKLHTREDVKKELSMMSFEDLIALQNKVGTKAFHRVVHGGDKDGGEKRQATKKRPNKNRPMEISSKRPVSFIRQIVPAKKSMSRDPRFDDLSGEYKADIFRKSYKFIDDIRRKEMEVVQKTLKKTKSTQKRQQLDFLLKRMKNQERARESEEQRRDRELQFKRQQRERASQGARPFFLKKSDKKKLQLAERYQELKKSGRLENFLKKKRKRNAGKDRRKLPAQQN